MSAGSGAPAPAPLRERILEATYACVARYGLGKTTVEDVVKESGVSRATIYRAFPGGRDELLQAVVGWEMDRFFLALGEAVAGAPSFTAMVEEGLTFAHRAVREHAVLQTMLLVEPERLLPIMTTEQHRPLRLITAYLRPLLAAEEAAGRVRPGVDVDTAAAFLARMILSLISSPGRWDLEDRDQVHDLVRHELLAGILSDPDAPPA